jgi:hypothetical protein
MRVRVGVIGGLMTMMVAFAGEASAAFDDIKWLGVHGAYYSKYEKAAVGVTARQHLGEEMGGELSTGFLLDYVFRSGGTTWVTGADLQYERFLAQKRLSLWAGGGGGVVRDDRHGPNEEPQYELFAVGILGAGLGGKPIMPYVEMRFMSHQKFHGVLYAGIRF